jgi:hypothetical protein
VPAAHVFAHAPQLASSVASSTHEVPQAMNVEPSAEQLHAPFTHCCVAPQATPQPPQFLGSVCVLIQVPAHMASPD